MAAGDKWWLKTMDGGDSAATWAKYDEEYRSREHQLTTNIQRLLTPKLNARARAEQPSSRAAYETLHGTVRYSTSSSFEHFLPRHTHTPTTPNSPSFSLPRRLRNGYFA